MAAITVFGGTTEGRILAEAFGDTSLELFVCVATSYGASLLPKCKNINIHTGRMDVQEMRDFLLSHTSDCCLDATHPYAQDVTKNIKKACKEAGILYVRIFREEGAHQEKEQGIYYKKDLRQAIKFLKKQEGNILITTGSRDLEAYTQIPNYEERCIARVLPGIEVLQKCESLGFHGKHVIAMQGPFGEDFNYWMLKETKASWLVTKNSGRTGGYEEKCAAAIRAGVGVVVIGRQEKETKEAMDVLEAIEWVKKRYNLAIDEKWLDDLKKRQIYLIGMGPGNPKMMTILAKEALENSDAVIGAGRVLQIWEEDTKKPKYNCYKKEDIFDILNDHPEYQKISIVYSGDLGFYSGARGMKELFPDANVHMISGIASPVAFLNELGIPWSEVFLTSCHGKHQNLLSLIQEHRYVCSLLGSENTVKDTCEQLIACKMTDVNVVLGEKISYPEENVTRGNPKDFLSIKYDPLSIVLFENPRVQKEVKGFGKKDTSFIRGKVPMTKEEVRTILLSKLHLRKDSILYDVGAGTGSVSIEAAQKCKDGMVYGIEKKEEAIHLLHKNKKKFGVSNFKIIEGEASEQIDILPRPTHAFLGGTGGKMMAIIEKIREKNKDTRFCITSVTLETLKQLEILQKKFPEYETMEIIQIQVSRAETMGKYHLMKAQNPVWIASFGGKEDE